MNALHLPWYPTLRRIIAPTEPLTNLALAVIIIASVLVLWRGGPVLKAAWVVYLVSP